MGFAIESNRRVTDANGQNLDSDELLAGFTDDHFRLVTEARSADAKDGRDDSIYSNVEFVTDPFDPSAPVDPVGLLLAGRCSCSRT